MRLYYQHTGSAAAATLLFLLSCISSSSAFSDRDMDNDSLRQAVQEYLEDPVAALEQYGPMEEWRTWKVTDTSRLFQAATDLDVDLSQWDVSGVTSMNHMFAGCSNYRGTGLEKWNTANVQDFAYMFAQATSLEGSSLSGWNTQEATTMEGMFQAATALTASLNDWNVDRVTNLESMFHGATSFNQPLNSWNVANAKYTNHLWEGASQFSQDICWQLNVQARCYQCFCGTAGAGFAEQRSQCKAQIHPSIEAYSQACNAHDNAEWIVYERPDFVVVEEEEDDDESDTGISHEEEGMVGNATGTDRSDTGASYGFDVDIDIDTPVFDNSDRNDGTGIGIIDTGSRTVAGIQSDTSGATNHWMESSVLFVVTAATMAFLVGR